MEAVGMPSLEVSYRREMKHNYLIIKAEGIEADNYEIRMLYGNPMDGVLRFRTKQLDGDLYFYYEITSRQPLSRVLDSRCIQEAEIRQMMLQAAQVLGEMEGYLLPEGRVLLEPDYIYIEPEDFQAAFCLVPGRPGSFPEGLSRLLQYLLKHVDHQDHKSVVLAYGLYQESLKDNYGMDDLLRLLSPSGKEAGGQPIDQKPAEEPEGRCRRQELSEPYPSFQGEGQKARTSDRKAAELPWTDGDGEVVRVRFPYKRVLLLGIMVPALPAAIWLILGVSGLYQYRILLSVAEAVLVLLLLLSAASGIWSGPSANQELGPSQEEMPAWQMVFSEEEPPEAPVKAAPAFEEPQTALLVDLAEGSGKEAGAANRLSSVDKRAEDIPIPYFPFIIGKQEGMTDYVLPFDTVSRLHIRLDRQGQAYQITDLNSTNGTKVRGSLLQNNQTVDIYPGDEVYIADLGFVFL